MKLTRDEIYDRINIEVSVQFDPVSAMTFLSGQAHYGMKNHREVFISLSDSILRDLEHQLRHNLQRQMEQLSDILAGEFAEWVPVLTGEKPWPKEENETKGFKSENKPPPPLTEGILKEIYKGTFKEVVFKYWNDFSSKNVANIKDITDVN